MCWTVFNYKQNEYKLETLCDYEALLCYLKHSEEKYRHEKQMKLLPKTK
jgi:hypothetical protein